MSLYLPETYTIDEDASSIVLRMAKISDRHTTYYEVI